MLFSEIRPSVAILRTQLKGSSHPSSSGSAFVVDGRGWMITNFHVVNSYLYDPERYDLAFEMPDGQEGTVDLIAVDVLNDLALVAPRSPLRAGSAHPIALPTPESAPRMARGTPLFSIGNPLDLGMTITTGSFSGMVQGSFDGQIHFSGALNPGMSGGPAVDERGRLVGVNVAHVRDAQSVSFLVPAMHVTRLYRAARQSQPPRLAALRGEVAQQLRARQAELVRLAFAEDWSSENLGNYRVPGFLAGYTDCGADSNASASAPPRVEFRSMNCLLKTASMPVPDESSSSLSYQHTLVRLGSPAAANSFRLASAASNRFTGNMSAVQNTHMARQICQSRFTQLGPKQQSPARILWCAQAYRDFPDLYDFQIAVATQHDGQSLLVSRLTLSGFTWGSAHEFTERLLGSIQ